MAVQVLLQELLEQAMLLADFLGEPDQRPAGGADVVDGRGCGFIEIAPRRLDEIDTVEAARSRTQVIVDLVRGG